MDLPVLVDAEWLKAHLGEVVVADVRWRLGQPQFGHTEHAAGRIPGSVFIDVDRDLADIGDPAKGRHPLPSPEEAARRLAAKGIGPDRPVVAFDDLGGATAARLWWMLRWLGGPPCAVLDGGYAAWVTAGGAVESGAPSIDVVAPWKPAVDESRRVSTEDVASGLPGVLIDARERDRYLGRTEPVDPIAGHIPGAVNAPWAENLNANGKFRDVAELRARYLDLGVTPAAVVYCGSGVTACHDLLAMAHAGLSARLYPGAWSAWSNDPRTRGRVERE